MRWLVPMSLLYKKNRTDFEFTLDMFSTLRTVFFRNTCTIIMFALISLVMQVCCIHIFLFSHFPFCAQHRNEIILKLKWNEIVYALLVSLLSFLFSLFMWCNLNWDLISILFYNMKTEIKGHPFPSNPIYQRCCWTFCWSQFASFLFFFFLCLQSVCLHPMCVYSIFFCFLHSTQKDR